MPSVRQEGKKIMRVTAITSATESSINLNYSYEAPPVTARLNPRQKKEGAPILHWPTEGRFNMITQDREVEAPIRDYETAEKSTNNAKKMITSQPAFAFGAQANESPEAALALL